MSLTSARRTGKPTKLTRGPRHLLKFRLMSRRLLQKKRLLPVLMLNEVGGKVVVVETTGTFLRVDTANQIINNDKIR